MDKKKFILKSDYKPTGDQPNAIEILATNRPGRSTLLGVTGSGKTFTIANLINRVQKPTLILAPNKTLAAQLYEEFSVLFPENKVCYFVSYYDYYQPESYLPADDVYIPKETKINAEIERLRIESVASIVSRQDVIVVASVSCIYSLGDPKEFKNLSLLLAVNQKKTLEECVTELVKIGYKRDDALSHYATFAVRFNAIDIFLPYQKELVRIQFHDGFVSVISLLNRLNYDVVQTPDDLVIFPATYFITTEEKKAAASKSILDELAAHLASIDNQLYHQRLYNRVMRDVELIRQTGTCPGVENYSAHFANRSTGVAPFTLLDFFDDALLVFDESHICIPQLRGMYAGDRSRKKALVEHGFRLPSAYDNRPLKFEEVERFFNDVVFVSATPGEYELKSSNVVAEQLIRPTGVVDPEIIILPRLNQMTVLMDHIQETIKAGNRVLVTVMTKVLAEELAKFLEKKEILVCYLHSDIKTPVRSEILHKLRTGVFDCLIGINLLREGLDLPEVGMVAVMDADCESFLRDKRSLIQIIGRAARNKESKVLFFADKITESMQAAIDETNRRRIIQTKYNKKHDITPQSAKRKIVKSISHKIKATDGQEKVNTDQKTRIKKRIKEVVFADVSSMELFALEKQMLEAAEKYEFEKAIELRKKWMLIKESLIKKDKK